MSAPGVPEPLVQRIVATAGRLAPAATGTPTLIDDLVDLAWCRLLPGLSDDQRGEAEAAAAALTIDLRQLVPGAR